VADATEGQEETTWARLARRKVVQWGIAYTAGAWGLLQGIAFMRDTFGWPHQIQQAAAVLLLTGLPIVMVLAWYHGERGQQRLSATEFVILTVLFLLGGGLFWRFEHAKVTPESSGAAPSTIPPTAAAFAAPADHSIAVLPFVNMSSDKEQEYFSDGLSEELLNLLAQVPQLRVIARTSSFSFKGKEVDIAEIARRLDVANVLEGSVRKSGATLRVTVQLVRTSDSSHLWSQTYDRQLTDVFEVQDEIAAAVVDQLRMKLLGPAPKARTADPKAYALFLQAREIGRQNTAEAFERSIRLYRRSLELDPGYPATWEGLAGAYCGQAFNFLRPADEAVRLAGEAIARALALDPDYAPAHARLGWIAIYHDLDLVAGARHLGHALALEPGDLDLLAAASNLARRLNRLDQAIALDEYVVTRDPVNAGAHDALAYSYLYAGRLDAAIAEYRSELDLSPASIGAHAMIGETLLHKDDAAAALVEMQKEPDEGSRLIGLAMAYHALGRKVESDAALAEVTRKYHSTMPYYIAFVFAFRGESDSAFEWLEKAVKGHDPALGSIGVYPIFGRLETDARWLPLLRTLRLAPEQLAAINFDVKVPN
jgi:TolB-like protein